MSRRRRPRCCVTALALAASFALAAPAVAQAPQPAPAQPAPPPPTPFPPSLQAGGLRPPPSTLPAGPGPVADPSQTEQDLERAKKEDSKRGLEWLWINADGGFSFADLRAFSGSDKDFTAGFVPTQSIGGSAGLGVGARILFLTVGARGRVGFYSPWQLFSVGGEIGLHFPLGRVEPHLELGGGYAALANVAGLAKGSSDAISVSGGYGRLSGGVDVYLMPLFSVGLLVSGDFLGMVRPGLSAKQIDAIKNDPKVSDVQRAGADALGTQGTSFGAAAGVTAVLGLHF